MTPSDLVLRFVSSVGNPRDAEFYLSLFRGERRRSFAIIAVSDSVMREAADALIVDLRFLAQLGLTPVIAFGVVEPAAAAQRARLVCERLAPEVECAIVEPKGAGAVADRGGIPLIPLGAIAASVDERFAALGALAAALGTRKLIFVGRRSGLQPIGESVRSLIDVTTEYDQIVSVLPSKQAALLAQVRRLLAAAPHPMTVAVTSPLDLLRELFTVRGAGTLIRRGSTITRAARYEEIDRPRLITLIEESFARNLAADFFTRPVRAIYVADEYAGVAITVETPLGPYLSKFAVGRRARGEGVGRDLWRALNRDCATLSWRARGSNPISPWYMENCDGFVRGDPWHVYWRGVLQGDIPAVIHYARTAADDFRA